MSNKPAAYWRGCHRAARPVRTVSSRSIAVILLGAFLADFSSHDMVCRRRLGLCNTAGNRSKCSSGLHNSPHRSLCGSISCDNIRHHYHHHCSTDHDTDTDNRDHRSNSRRHTARRRRLPSTQGTRLPTVSKQAFSSCSPGALYANAPDHVPRQMNATKIKLVNRCQKRQLIAAVDQDMPAWTYAGAVQSPLH